MRATLGALASFNADERSILLKVRLYPFYFPLPAIAHEPLIPAHGCMCRSFGVGSRGLRLKGSTSLPASARSTCSVGCGRTSV
jgi:hypothetical protein